MAGAFDYALAHWEGPTRFLDDGRIPWTNNERERHLRHLVVGRKGWGFSLDALSDHHHTDAGSRRRDAVLLVA